MRSKNCKEILRSKITQRIDEQQAERHKNSARVWRNPAITQKLHFPQHPPPPLPAQQMMQPQATSPRFQLPPSPQQGYHGNVAGRTFNRPPIVYATNFVGNHNNNRNPYASKGAYSGPPAGTPPQNHHHVAKQQGYAPQQHQVGYQDNRAVQVEKKRATPVVTAQSNNKQANYRPSNQLTKQVNSQVNANQPPVNMQPSSYANKPAQMSVNHPPVNSNYAQPPSFNTQSPVAGTSFAHTQQVNVTQPPTPMGTQNIAHAPPMTTKNIARSSQLNVGQSSAYSKPLNFTQTAPNSQPSSYLQPTQNNTVQSTSYPQGVQSNVGQVDTQLSYNSQPLAAKFAQSSVQVSSTQAPTYSHSQNYGQMSVASPSTITRAPQPSSSQSFQPINFAQGPQSGGPTRTTQLPGHPHVPQTPNPQQSSFTNAPASSHNSSAVTHPSVVQTSRNSPAANHFNNQQTSSSGNFQQPITSSGGNFSQPISSCQKPSVSNGTEQWGSHKQTVSWIIK